MNKKISVLLVLGLVLVGCVRNDSSSNTSSTSSLDSTSTSSSEDITSSTIVEVPPITYGSIAELYTAPVYSSSESGLRKVSGEIVAKNLRAFVIYDGESAIQVFLGANDPQLDVFSVGNYVSVVGVLTLFSGTKQIASPASVNLTPIITLEGGHSVLPAPTPIVVDGASLDAYQAGTLKPLALRVVVTASESLIVETVVGATKVTSVNYYNGNHFTAEKVGSIYDIVGWATGVNDNRVEVTVSALDDVTAIESVTTLLATLSLNYTLAIGDYQWSITENGFVKEVLVEEELDLVEGGVKSSDGNIHKVWKSDFSGFYRVGYSDDNYSYESYSERFGLTNYAVNDLTRIDDETVELVDDGVSNNLIKFLDILLGVELTKVRFNVVSGVISLDLYVLSEVVGQAYFINVNSTHIEAFDEHVAADKLPAFNYEIIGGNATIKKLLSHYYSQEVIDKLPNTVGTQSFRFNPASGGNRSGLNISFTGFLYIYGVTLEEYNEQLTISAEFDKESYSYFYWNLTQTVSAVTYWGGWPACLNIEIKETSQVPTTWLSTEANARASEVAGSPIVVPALNGAAGYYYSYGEIAAIFADGTASGIIDEQVATWKAYLGTQGWNEVPTVNGNEILDPSHKVRISLTHYSWNTEVTIAFGNPSSILSDVWPTVDLAAAVSSRFSSTTTIPVLSGDLYALDTGYTLAVKVFFNEADSSALETTKSTYISNLLLQDWVDRIVSYGNHQIQSPDGKIAISLYASTYTSLPSISVEITAASTPLPTSWPSSQVNGALLDYYSTEILVPALTGALAYSFSTYYEGGVEVSGYFATEDYETAQASWISILLGNGWTEVPTANGVEIQDSTHKVYARFSSSSYSSSVTVVITTAHEGASSVWPSADLPVFPGTAYASVVDGSLSGIAVIGPEITNVQYEALLVLNGFTRVFANPKYKSSSSYSFIKDEIQVEVENVTFNGTVRVFTYERISSAPVFTAYPNDALVANLGQATVDLIPSLGEGQYLVRNQKQGEVTYYVNNVDVPTYLSTLSTWEVSGTGDYSASILVPSDSSVIAISQTFKSLLDGSYLVTVKSSVNLLFTSWASFYSGVNSLSGNFTNYPPMAYIPEITGTSYLVRQDYTYAYITINGVGETALEDFKTALMSGSYGPYTINGTNYQNTISLGAGMWIIVSDASQIGTTLSFTLRVW